jgi:hypothetical protein
MGADSYRPRPALYASEEWRSPAGWLKFDPPICNTNGRPSRGREVNDELAKPSHYNWNHFSLIRNRSVTTARHLLFCLTPFKLKKGEPLCQ